MSVDDYPQQELAHIERMIVELERLTQNGRVIAERNTVTRPEYWRNRIHAFGEFLGGDRVHDEACCCFIGKADEPIRGVGPT